MSSKRGAEKKPDFRFWSLRMGNTVRPHPRQRDASHRTFQLLQITGSKVYSGLQSMVDWLEKKNALNWERWEIPS